MDPRATSHAPSLLADGIDFIKDDDVQTTVSTKLAREEIILKVISFKYFEYIFKQTCQKNKAKLPIDGLRSTLTNKYSKSSHGCSLSKVLDPHSRNSANSKRIPEPLIQ